MASQVILTAEPRDETSIGKGPAGRLRKEGRVPAVLYGSDIGSIACHVDALEIYRALRTEAGSNVLIRLQVGGEEHLSIVREIQRHPVRGNVLHVDFQNVDRDQLIPADIPIRLENEDGPAAEGGIVNLVLYTVPIHVTPLEIPTEFVLDVGSLTIGDVLRIEDIVSQLPDGATVDIDEDRTIVTINAPVQEVEEEPEEGELLEGEEAVAEAAEEAGEEADSGSEESDGDE